MHDKHHLARSSISVLDRYYRSQYHSSPQEAVAVEEAEVVAEVEVVAVEVVGEYHLGRTDRKQLSTHTQGNNSTVLVVEVVEVGDIQDSH